MRTLTVTYNPENRAVLILPGLTDLVALDMLRQSLTTGSATDEEVAHYVTWAADRMAVGEDPTVILHGYTHTLTTDPTPGPRYDRHGKADAWAFDPDRTTRRETFL